MVRISEIHYYHISLPLKSPFQTSFGEIKNRETIIVKFVGEDLEGFGEIPVNAGPWYSYETIKTALHISLDYIAPNIINKDIANMSDIIDTMKHVRGHEMAKAGHEMALLDLLAKKRKMSLAKFLGGARKKIEVGVSVGVIGDMSRLLREISNFLDQGYNRIKIKIKPGWDIKPIEYIRKEFGEVKLQVDANASYDIDMHINILKKLDEYNLIMIEQPFHYNDLYEHAILGGEIATPICLDESIKCIHDVEAAVALGSCDIINVKPARVGGLLATKEINEYTKMFYIPIWIGGLLESGVGRGHLIAAATLDNVRYPCDISASNRYYEEDIVEPEWIMKKGYIEVPNKSGIGVEVLEEKIKKYLIKEYKLVS